MLPAAECVVDAEAEAEAGAGAEAKPDRLCRGWIGEENG